MSSPQYPAGLPTKFAAWIALPAAFLAMIPNLLTYCEYQNKMKDPQMDWGMPDRVRLVQYQGGNEAIIEAYVQPTFVNRGLNEKVDVIRGMSLSVEPAKGDSPALDFRWRNHGKFSAATTDGSSTKCVAEEYTGDTTSLVVAPNQPLAPVVLFGPKAEQTEPFFEPGRYHMTLAVERTVNEDLLEKTVVVTLTQAVIDLMEECKSAVLVPAN